MVLVLLTDGMEEIEALTPVDYLRRAGLQVCTLGVTGLQAHGSHGITVQADALLTDFVPTEPVQAVVLPGGKLGIENLRASSAVKTLLEKAYADGAWLAAICSAPTILAAWGYTDGQVVTCYPGWEQQLPAGVTCSGDAVECLPERRIITGRSVGTSGSFALAIVAALQGEQAARELKKTLYPNW